MKKHLVLFGIMVAGLALASLAGAAPVKLLSPERVSVFAGVDHVWFAQAGEEPLAAKRQWEARGQVGLAVVPRVSAVLPVAYGFKDEFVRAEPGARLRLTDGAAPIALQLGLGYAFTWASGTEPVPTFAKEWVGGAYAAKSLTPAGKAWSLIATASSRYGFDNKQAAIRAGLVLGWTASPEGF